MSVANIEKLASVFVKVAELTEKQKAQIQAWKAEMSKLVKVLPVGIDIETSNYPAAKQWRLLRRKIKNLKSSSEGSYRKRADIMRKNRAIVDLINRAVGKAGADKGLIQNLSKHLAAQKVKPQTMVVNLMFVPNSPTTVKVSGGNAPLQQYVAKAVAPTAKWLDAAMKKQKLVPSTSFPYVFAKLP